jgi:arginine:pyruvate transaminase
VLVAEAMLFGSQPFIEDALVVALNEQHDEVQRMRVAYRERAQALVEAINGSSAVSARMPEGGMFVMVDVRATNLSGEEFAWKLLDEHNIGVMPGESFGLGGAGHIRIALTIEASVLRTACATIRTMAETLAAKAK